MMAIIDRKNRSLYRAMSLWQRFMLSMLWTVGLIGVGWLTWCALDRELPTEVTGLQAAPVVVGGGQPVTITFNVIRRRVCSSRGESTIIDATGVRWPFDPTPWRILTDKIGTDTTAARFIVPPSAAPGVARYRLVYYQKCAFNPVHLLWPIVDVADDVTFEIVPGRIPPPQIVP